MKILDAIIAELERQHDESRGFGLGCFEANDPSNSLIDGRVDLVALANAVEAALVAGADVRCEPDAAATFLYAGEAATGARQNVSGGWEPIIETIITMNGAPELENARVAVLNGKRFRLVAEDAVDDLQQQKKEADRAHRDHLAQMGDFREKLVRYAAKDMQRGDVDAAAIKNAMAAAIDETIAVHLATAGGE